MSDRIWSDTNKTKMSNRLLPMFPITETNQYIDGSGNPIVTQQTVGGFTKFEQGVFLIAQGLAQSGIYTPNEIGKRSIEITTEIFDLLESNK